MRLERPTVDEPYHQTGSCSSLCARRRRGLGWRRRVELRLERRRFHSLAQRVDEIVATGWVEHAHKPLAVDRLGLIQHSSQLATLGDKERAVAVAGNAHAVLGIAEHLCQRERQRPGLRVDGPFLVIVLVREAVAAIYESYYRCLPLHLD